MAESYFLCVLHNIPDEWEDIVSSLCFDYGALGVCEALRFQQTATAFDPQTIPTSHHTLEVYFKEAPLEEFFSDLLALNAEIQYKLVQEQERDWLEEWKKGFSSFSLVNDIWVVPSWLSSPAEARVSLKIDPGLAFGTGTHETTQLAAALMSDLEWRSVDRVLDVGTGTGILGFLAESYGAKKVVATEIDPLARQTARENVVLNDCRVMTVVDESVGELTERFDLVVANIIDGVLLRLQDDLIRCVEESGYLLLTGILTERKEIFEAGLTLPSHQFELLRCEQKGDWWGYLWKRNRYYVETILD